VQLSRGQEKDRGRWKRKKMPGPKKDKKMRAREKKMGNLIIKKNLKLTI
jgi:hypothetical protein